MWDETQEIKGSAEIGIYLLKYFRSLRTYIRTSYADTCGEQNQNQNVFAVLLYAVNTIGNIKQIDLKFMESGLSYLKVDRIQATIDKCRRKQHKNLYVPNDNKLLIEMSRKKSFPYVVY